MTVATPRIAVRRDPQEGWAVVSDAPLPLSTLAVVPLDGPNAGRWVYPRRDWESAVSASLQAYDIARRESRLWTLMKSIPVGSRLFGRTR